MIDRSVACHSTIPARPLPEAHTADSYLRLALAQLDQGNTDDAEATLRQALHLNPDHAETLYRLGLMRARRGDRFGARPILLAALRASERRPAQPALAVSVAAELARLLQG